MFVSSWGMSSLTLEGQGNPARRCCVSQTFLNGNTGIRDVSHCPFIRSFPWHWLWPSRPPHQALQAFKRPHWVNLAGTEIQSKSPEAENLHHARESKFAKGSPCIWPSPIPFTDPESPQGQAPVLPAFWKQRELRIRNVLYHIKNPSKLVTLFELGILLYMDSGHLLCEANRTLHGHYMSYILIPF